MNWDNIHFDNIRPFSSFFFKSFGKKENSSFLKHSTVTEKDNRFQGPKFPYDYDLLQQLETIHAFYIFNYFG